jgi:methyl-accepting chemotaxis protein
MDDGPEFDVDRTGDRFKMATMFTAMWLEDSDPGGNRHLIIIFIGLMAVAIAIMAIIMVAIAVAAMKTIKELGATAAELKTKFLPLLDEVMEISKTSRVLLQESAPKIKVIADNLVKTSDTLVQTSKAARGAMQQVEVTVSDANLRAQRQVARVDGMVSAALTTTAEVVETISHGIRVPAQKIAEIVTQAKFVGEGLLAKVKSMVDRTPFGSRY